MRATITHGVKKETTGVFKKTTQEYTFVDCTVKFSEEELALIRRWDLWGYKLLDRDMNVDLKEGPHTAGLDRDHFALRISSFGDGNESYTAHTVFWRPTEALTFTEALKGALQRMHNLIMNQADYQGGTETVEL